MGVVHTPDSNAISENVKIDKFKVSVMIRPSEIKDIEIPFRKMTSSEFIRLAAAQLSLKPDQI